jgi:hypothetical protein
MVTCCDRDGLLRIRAWRRHNIHIGLSPRVSPVWEGLLCGESATSDSTADYARLFDTALFSVGPRRHRHRNHRPDVTVFTRMRHEGGPEFRWIVIVEDEHMMYRFPYGYPDRAKRGEMNPRFLDPRSLHRRLLPLLDLFEPQIAAVVLRVGPIARTEGVRSGTFHERLFRCLDALSVFARSCRFAVELAGPEFVVPEYLVSLHRRNIVHVPAGQQLLDAFSMPDVLTSDLCVLRSDCLVAEEEGDAWFGFRQAVRCCLENRTTLYAYLGDGSESITTEEQADVLRGTGPGRLVRLLAGLDADLARLSPIRQKAA